MKVAHSLTDLIGNTPCWTWSAMSPGGRGGPDVAAGVLQPPQLRHGPGGLLA